MDLVFVLGFLVGEGDVERDLIGLIDYRTMAGGHFTDVKMQDSRDGFQVSVGAVDEFLRGLRLVRLGPENDDVRKHGSI